MAKLAAYLDAVVSGLEFCDSCHKRVHYVCSANEMLRYLRWNCSK